VPVPADAPDPAAYRHLQFGTADAAYRYEQADGGLVGVVWRWNNPDGTKRSIMPGVLVQGKRGPFWKGQGLPTPTPLYRLSVLATMPADAQVLVVEGEKSADAAARYLPDGAAVVASIGGSIAAGKSDWSPLRGRRVAIWRDNDDPGTSYASAVAELLKPIAAGVTVIELPPGLPPAWDLADPLPPTLAEDAVKAIIAEALLPSAMEIEPEPSLVDVADVSEVANLGAELHRLAALSPIDYDRQREAAAAQLGIRLGTLDAEIDNLRPSAPVATAVDFEDWKIEPWPERVGGAALLDDMVATFTAHLALPEHAAETMALWVLHAHAHDSAVISPFLTFSSPEKRCGKTRALQVLSLLTPRPQPASNVSPAVLFRAIERWRPTLLIDEAETFTGDNDELRGILNAGHSRAGAYVLRCVGENFEPARFSVWAPKAVALIGALPGTLADRSIIITMRRKRPGERVERLRLDAAGPFADLCRRAARWAADNDAVLRRADPAMPEGLNDRAMDNWRHLVAIADRAGGAWPERARAAALALSAGEDDTTSTRTMLLADIRDAFNEIGNDRISSAELAERLARLEHRPWPEWRHGKPITPRQLARLLAPFGIAPGTIRTGVDNTPKGYSVPQFLDAFGRYLPTDPPHRHNPQETTEKGEIRSATWGAVVADEKTPKPKEAGTCGVVADRKVETCGKEGKWAAFSDGADPAAPCSEGA
jgi:putative DNA primase/helicase